MAFKTYLNAGAGAGGGGMAPVASPSGRRRHPSRWPPDVLYMIALVVPRSRSSRSSPSTCEEDVHA